MRIEMISGVCLGNGVDGEPGKDYEVEKRLAESLILRGKAKPFEAKEAKPLERMKAGELVTYAEENGLDIGGLQPQAGAPKILAAVQAAIAAKAEA